MAKTLRQTQFEQVIGKNLSAESYENLKDNELNLITVFLQKFITQPSFNGDFLLEQQFRKTGAPLRAIKFFNSQILHNGPNTPSPLPYFVLIKAYKVCELPGTTFKNLCNNFTSQCYNNPSWTAEQQQELAIQMIDVATKLHSKLGLEENIYGEVLVLINRYDSINLKSWLELKLNEEQLSTIKYYLEVLSNISPQQLPNTLINKDWINHFGLNRCGDFDKATKSFLIHCLETNTGIKYNSGKSYEDDAEESKHSREHLTKFGPLMQFHQMVLRSINKMTFSEQSYECQLNLFSNLTFSTELETLELNPTTIMSLTTYNADNNDFSPQNIMNFKLTIKQIWGNTAINVEELLPKPQVISTISHQQTQIDVFNQPESTFLSNTSKKIEKQTLKLKKYFKLDGSNIISSNEQVTLKDFLQSPIDIKFTDKDVTVKDILNIANISINDFKDRLYSKLADTWFNCFIIADCYQEQLNRDMLKEATRHRNEIIILNNDIKEHIDKIHTKYNIELNIETYSENPESLHANLVKLNNLDNLIYQKIGIPLLTCDGKGKPLLTLPEDLLTHLKHFVQTEVKKTTAIELINLLSETDKEDLIKKIAGNIHDEIRAKHTIIFHIRNKEAQITNVFIQRVADPQLQQSLCAISLPFKVKTIDELYSKPKDYLTKFHQQLEQYFKCIDSIVSTTIEVTSVNLINHYADKNKAFDYNTLNEKILDTINNLPSDIDESVLSKYNEYLKKLGPTVKVSASYLYAIETLFLKMHQQVIDSNSVIIKQLKSQHHELRRQKERDSGAPDLSVAIPRDTGKLIQLLHTCVMTPSKMYTIAQVIMVHIQQDKRPSRNTFQENINSNPESKSKSKPNLVNTKEHRTMAKKNQTAQANTPSLKPGSKGMNQNYPRVIFNFVVDIISTTMVYVFLLPLNFFIGLMAVASTINLYSTLNVKRTIRTTSPDPIKNQAIKLPKPKVVIDIQPATWAKKNKDVLNNDGRLTKYIFDTTSIKEKSLAMNALKWIGNQNSCKNGSSSDEDFFKLMWTKITELFDTLCDDESSAFKNVFNDKVIGSIKNKNTPKKQKSHFLNIVHQHLVTSLFDDITSSTQAKQEEIAELKKHISENAYSNIYKKCKDINKNNFAQLEYDCLVINNSFDQTIGEDFSKELSSNSSDFENPCCA